MYSIYSISSPKLTCKFLIFDDGKKLYMLPQLEGGGNSGNARKNAFFFRTTNFQRYLLRRKQTTKHNKHYIALIVVSGMGRS